MLSLLVTHEQIKTLAAMGFTENNPLIRLARFRAQPPRPTTRAFYRAIVAVVDDRYYVIDANGTVHADAPPETEGRVLADAPPKQKERE